MDAVTANVYERVLEFASSVGSGTAFTIDVGASQYLVTARHLLPSDVGTPQVTVSNRFGSHLIPFQPLPMNRANADIAITRLVKPITAQLPLFASMAGLVYSQEVFFLGFPYGLGLTTSPNGHRIAFAKRAILSASDVLKGVETHYLDGHNNPGFSGGPVVGFNVRTHEPQVFAVVSGYLPEQMPLCDGDTTLSVTSVANTGIVVATDIKYAVDAISLDG